MSKARRSVSPEILEQYESFTQKQKQQWSASAAGESGNVYNIDEAAAEQSREEKMLEGIDDSEQNDDVTPEPVLATSSDSSEATKEE